MSDVTRILEQIRDGDTSASERLLREVYDELRRLAGGRLARERSGQTLQATALVHEAWLRLAGGDAMPQWSNRRHFFAAAAEAMRRILVESARRKARARHGGGLRRVDLESQCDVGAMPEVDILALDEALMKLGATEGQSAKAEVVKLRFFGGLTMPEVAAALDISLATAERHWTYARAWLYRELSDSK
ncbi:MAG: ECF-type sigma factor [Planctomycetota bacterium]